MALISANLTGIALASQSTISYVNVNDRAYQDIEIVITDDSKILVPFKQLADIFKIQYTANRVDKMISFKTHDGKDGVINLNGVFVEDYPLTKTPAIFLTQGIMEGIFNEAYISADVAEKIFDVKIETDFENLAIKATVNRDIPLLASNNLLTADDKGPHAYQDVISPKKPGKITLNTIGLRSNMMNDYMGTSTPTYSDTNNTFAGNTELSASGNIMGGKYRIAATESHYRTKPFMFSGVTATYANKFTDKKNDKTYWYELGRVTGRTHDDTAIGTNIFGAQIWNYDYNREDPHDIHGYVKPTSLVCVIANGQDPITISTYAGYYTLKDVQLPNPVTYLRIEEVNEDGTTEVIREEKYNIYGNDKPFKDEQRGSAYAGVWGYQDRLFREGQEIYRGNNKKVTAGGYYQKGLSDNTTFESKLTADKLYEKNGSSVIYRVPTNDTLLVSGTQKSVNYLEGATTLNSVDWKSDKIEGLKAIATVGGSVSHDIRESQTRLGYIAKGSGEYEKDLSKFSLGILKPKKVSAKLDAFHSSQDFYIASSDSTSKNDRTGGKASANLSFNSTSVGGSYSRYYSNLNQRYDGGKITFDEATVHAATKIPKVANLNFTGYYKQGENDFGKNKNYFYDGSATRDIGKWATVSAGYRENSYDTQYYVSSEDNRNYFSKYRDIYQQITTPIPHNLGRFTLGHSFTRYETSSYKNGYNIFRFGYVFPTWKNWTLGLNWGLRYYGQSGSDLGASISHRSRSGQTATLSYQYSKYSGYFIDNMFTPDTNRHSVNFTFNDAFQVFNHGFKSVGTEDLNRGIFEAIAFVDVNKNGMYDKKIDIPVKNVQLNASWAGDTFITNKRGRASSTSLEEGIYKVNIDMKNLPITVAPATNDIITKTIRINGGQTTTFEIPMISTVGSVSGRLDITDDFDRNLPINDFIVVLLDEEGNEVSYSTLGYDGEFYISGLAPGKYKLQLDQQFINAYGLEEVQNKSSRDIFIPYDY
ncbi:MAG: hypothetical protein MJ231_05700, partial [bacterium]|nr:hypothetical protein [bacterium]